MFFAALASGAVHPEMERKAAIALLAAAVRGEPQAAAVAEPSTPPPPTRIKILTCPCCGSPFILMIDPDGGLSLQPLDAPVKSD